MLRFNDWPYPKFSPCGDRVLVRVYSGTSYLYARTESGLAQVAGRLGPFLHLAFKASGLIYGEKFNAGTTVFSSKFTEIGPIDRVASTQAIRPSHDGRFLYYKASDSWNRYDTKTGEAHNLGFPCVAPHPDCETLLFCKENLTESNGADHSLRVIGGPARPDIASYGPDGRTILLRKGSTIFLLEAATGRFVVKQEFPGSAPWTFHPLGRRVAIGGHSGVTILDCAGGRTVGSLEAVGGPNHVTAVDWSPDGKFLATGSTDGRVRFWDAETRKEVASLKRRPMRRLTPEAQELARATLRGDAVAPHALADYLEETGSSPIPYWPTHLRRGGLKPAAWVAG